MSAAAAAVATGMEPRLWAPSTSSQGRAGCELSWAATDAIGISWPVFQSRWESTTSRVSGVRAAASLSCTAAAACSGLLVRSATARLSIDSWWRRASSRQAATTPGCSQSLISSRSPVFQGRPQSGSTQPAVTFSVKASLFVATPSQQASLCRSLATVRSTSGHTAAVNGPSS